MFSEGEVQDNNENDEQEMNSAMAKRKVVDERKFKVVFEEKEMKTIKEIKIVKDKEKTQKKFRSRKLQDNVQS